MGIEIIIANIELYITVFFLSKFPIINKLIIFIKN